VLVHDQGGLLRYRGAGALCERACQVPLNAEVPPSANLKWFVLLERYQYLQALRPQHAAEARDIVGTHHPSQQLGAPSGQPGREVLGGERNAKWPICDGNEPVEGQPEADTTEQLQGRVHSQSLDWHRGRMCEHRSGHALDIDVH